MSTTGNTNMLGPYTDTLNYLGYTWDSLPTLDLGNRQGSTDYIDFVDVSEMKAPVMKFIDKFNRRGLLLCLRGSGMGRPYYSHDDTLRKVWEEPKYFTLALFQRYTDGDQWNFGWGNSDHSLQQIAPAGAFLNNTVHPAALTCWLKHVDPVIDVCLPDQEATTVVRPEEEIATTTQ